MTFKDKNTVVVKVDKETLSITHICDGEEVITGGDDGQTYVATFAHRWTANVFIALVKHSPLVIYGEHE